MNKRVLWTGLSVLLLAGLLAVLFTRGEDTRGVPLTTAPAPSAPAVRPGAPKAPPSVPTPTARPPAPSSHSVPLRLVPAATTTEDKRASHGAFEGRVVSATDGAGVNGAELTFSSDTGGASSVRTGADGRFRFLPEAPGTYQLAVVTAKGYLPFGPEWGQSPIRLTASEGQRISDIVLALTPEVELVGKVLSPEGQPVPGARIRLLTGRTGESVLFPINEGFTSDADGEFRFHAPEGAQLEARHPDYASARGEVTPSVALSRRMELTLGRRGGLAAADAGTRPSATEVLAGRVVDARSAPVPGALVSVRTAARAYPAVFGDSMGYEALTDAEGRFTVEGLEPGTYDITALQMGLAPARLTDVAAGRKDLTLTLSEGTKLMGFVREASTGAPVVSFSVGVMLKIGPLQRESFTQLSFIDPQGRYEVAGLPAGSYVMQVAAPGYAPAEGPVEVAGAATAPVRADFALSRGARLTGRVVEAASKSPIAQARISVEGISAEGALSVRFDALSDAKGDFAIDGLPPQEVSLYAAADGHHSRILSNILARPGAEPLVIALRKTEAGEEPQIELVGIGAVLAARDDALVVGQVIPGGGAAEAGLAAGDGIVRIDGVPVVEMGFGGAINRIRGPENSRVVLSIRRSPAGDAGPVPTVDIPVTRKRIQQ
jgi:hypothetical protein